MKRPPCFVLLLVLAVLLSILVGVDRADAQTIVATPSTIVVFTPAIDHALVSEYEFGYFVTSTDETPIRASRVPRGSVVLESGEFNFPYPRLAFGSFSHKLRACAPAIPSGEKCSAWAPAPQTVVVNPFNPTAVRVQ